MWGWVKQPMWATAIAPMYTRLVCYALVTPLQLSILKCMLDMQPWKIVETCARPVLEVSAGYLHSTIGWHTPHYAAHNHMSSNTNLHKGGCKRTWQTVCVCVWMPLGKLYHDP